MLRRVSLLCLLLGMLAGCTYPRDPSHTMDEVINSGTMLVGVSEAPPWIVRIDDQATGPEADLISKFAQHLGVDVQWVWAPLEANLEALKERQLHVVVGGLSKQTPWGQELALTTPYVTEHFIIGAPNSFDAPAEGLENQRVAVEPGSVLGAYVVQKDGVAVPTPDRQAADMLVAGALWEIRAWEMKPLPMSLGQVEHVMAVSRGENRWLIALDQFLQQQDANEIMQQLEEEATQ